MPCSRSSSPNGHSSLSSARKPVKAGERAEHNYIKAFAILALGLVSACGSTPQNPQKENPTTTSGCVIDRVIDGDTVHLSCPNNRGDNLRLMGYDTPETYRPKCSAELRLGTEATRRLVQELNNASTITTEAHGRDKYQRVLAKLYLDNRDVADIMIAAGLAVRYSGGKRINWCAVLGA